MELFTAVYKDTYRDSLAMLSFMAEMMEQEGIQTVYAGMAVPYFKETLKELQLFTDEAGEAKENDLVICAMAENRAYFDQAVDHAFMSEAGSSAQAQKRYQNLNAAVSAHPEANICSISVPGEYALEVTKEALSHGLHCIVFSANVPLEQEREMKEYAREKGLLCMGPDCGVTNINGTAFVLSSINNRGPFGIVGASGCGIQHVAAMLHEQGSGVTQTIGTGGKDLTETVGGITFLMGIDALEEDEDTKYIICISRKPPESVLRKVLDRISRCRKPVIACFMGADKQLVESSGAIWTEDLDRCGQAALSLLGKDYSFDTDEEILALAMEAVKGLRPEQKYVRGVFCGGTYCDEAMKTMQPLIGGIYSNVPLSPELQLIDPLSRKGNTVIDAGEEEYTQGRPHPALEPSVRVPLIEKEGEDPETAVLLFDLILCPPEHMDPAGVTLEGIRAAREKAAERGGKLIAVASVLGTDRDLQNVHLQREELSREGVYVMRTNRQAAQLAAAIVNLRGGKTE